MARRIHRRNKKDTSYFFLIALEDSKSSRYYFQQLIREKGLNAEVTCVPHSGTAPKSVLNGIDRFLSENSRCKPTRSWIVIDKDDFPKENFKGAIERARQRDICVAYSNESYELWLLLHFENVCSHMGRDEINRQLNTHFQSNYRIEYNKNVSDIYTILKPRQEVALKRAKKLIDDLIKLNGQLDPYNDNPSTTVNFLVACLENFEQCKKDSFPCPF